MRDAYGGITSLVIIVVFLVLVSGYLAFNVNYTKAFRVKNKIITLFEQYEGNCGQGPGSSECDTKIETYVNNIGYSISTSNPMKPEDLTCPPGDISDCQRECVNAQGYCWMKVKVDTPDDVAEERAYFKIATRIEMDIPIINKIMPALKVFQISGDTKVLITK